MRGDFPEFTGVGEAQRFKDGFDEIVAVDDKRVFMKTKNPIPDFIAWHTGAGYHIFYYGPSEYLQKVGSEGYTKDPLGGGPYTVSDWKPGERLLLERWDDFWGDTAWYHKPQHQELELILTTDEAARFAMIKSDQVDMVVNIPYAVAEKLARSEEAIGRGINPGKGDIWTTAVGATGNMSIVFETLFCPLDCAEKPDPSESKPWDDIRVREALELAVDKVAISRDAHFGFTNPMGGLWFSGSFGYRPELPVSEFNPEKARQLLEEAGYGDGIDADVYYAPFTNLPGPRHVA